MISCSSTEWLVFLTTSEAEADPLELLERQDIARINLTDLGQSVYSLLPLFDPSGNYECSDYWHRRSRAEYPVEYGVRRIAVLELDQAFHDILISAIRDPESSALKWASHNWLSPMGKMDEAERQSLSARSIPVIKRQLLELIHMAKSLVTNCAPANGGFFILRDSHVVQE